MVDRQNQPAAWRRALESRRVTKAARRDKQRESRALASTSRAPRADGTPVGRGQGRAGVCTGRAVSLRLGRALGTNGYTPRYTAPKPQAGCGLRGDHVFPRHRVHPRSEPATLYLPDGLAS
jgi:hypothetical protein